jgi:hypothetical protein
MAYLVGGLLVVSGLIHVAILLIGGGSWMGPLSFRKPAVFGISFGVTLINVVWISSYLTLRPRLRALLVSTFAVACVIETALVSIQAWRGVPSHFNVETTLDGIIARMLAAGGLALVIIIVTLTIAAFRFEIVAPASMRLAIRVGLVTLVGAQLVGGLMIATGMRLVFAGNAPAAYATGGAFKPIHFVTMHAILVLPVMARLLSLAGWDEPRRLRSVQLAAMGYIVLVGVVIAWTVSR